MPPLTGLFLLAVGIYKDAAPTALTRGNPISIHQHQHRCVLRGLDHIFKRLVLGVGFLEFGGNIRDGFEEAQEQAALHRVVHIL